MLFALIHLPLYGLSAMPIDVCAGVFLGSLRVISGGVVAPALATLGGDLNGDGTMDLVAVNPVGTWVMLNTGSAFSSPAKWWDGNP